MTCGLDEVETSVNAVVDDLGPVDAVLLLEVAVEAGLDVLHDGFPAAVCERDASKKEKSR